VEARLEQLERRSFEESEASSGRVFRKFDELKMGPPLGGSEGQLSEVLLLLLLVVLFERLR